jgi:Na+/melibiose symporter-like transporter
MNELLAIGTALLLMILTTLPKTKKLIDKHKILLKVIFIVLCIVLYFLSENKDKPYTYIVLLGIIGYVTYEIYKLNKQKSEAN